MSETMNDKPEIIVSGLREEDLEPIGEVHLQSWVETYQNPVLGVDEAWIRENIGFVASPVGTEHRRKVMEQIDSERDEKYYRVARDKDSKLVGFCMASRGDEINEIDALYLLNGTQGKGLGSKLMQDMLDWLGDDKPTRLEVVEYNQKAIDFYKNFGFELTEESAKVWIEPVKAIEMRRKPK